MAEQTKRTLPFTSVSFSFPDRAIVVKDKKTGKQTATGIAQVHIGLSGGAMTLQTIVWESVPTETPDGMVQELTVSLPRGFELVDRKDETLKDALDAWKLGVLTAYDAWREGASKDGKSAPKARNVPRLVKRVQPTPATPANGGQASA